MEKIVKCSLLESNSKIWCAPTRGSSAIRRKLGEGASQRIRKRVKEIFGWLKTVAFLRKSHHRGQSKVGWALTFAIAAYNLVRMRNLAMETPA